MVRQGSKLGGDERGGRLVVEREEKVGGVGRGDVGHLTAHHDARGANRWTGGVNGEGGGLSRDTRGGGVRENASPPHAARP